MGRWASAARGDGQAAFDRRGGVGWAGAAFIELQAGGAVLGEHHLEGRSEDLLEMVQPAVMPAEAVAAGRG